MVEGSAQALFIRAAQYFFTPLRRRHRWQSLTTSNSAVILAVAPLEGVGIAFRTVVASKHVCVQPHMTPSCGQCGLPVTVVGHMLRAKAKDGLTVPLDGWGF